MCNQSRSQRLAVCSDQVAHSSKSGSGNHYHSFSNSKSFSGGLLFGNPFLWFVTLLHFSALLETVELNVAVGSEVWTNTTVGTVGSSAARDGALDNDVADDASVDVELGSLGVGLEVDEELTHGLDGLLGPSTLSVLECFALSVAADTSSVPAEGNNHSVFETVLQV